MSLRRKKTKSPWTYSDLDAAAARLGITYDLVTWSGDNREARLLHEGRPVATAYPNGDFVTETGTWVNKADMIPVKEADPELERLIAEEETIEAAAATAEASTPSTAATGWTAGSTVNESMVETERVHSLAYYDANILRTLVRHLVLNSGVPDGDTQLVELLDEIMGY